MGASADRHRGNCLDGSGVQSTIDYVRQRKVFGQAVLDFQTTKHKLAEMKTEIHIGRIFVDRCVRR